MEKRKGIPLIEREYFRKTLYQGTIKGISKYLGDSLNEKNISNLLLRYVFNKIPGRGESDDPVFIITPSAAADDQIRKDYVWYKIRRNPNELISYITREFTKNAKLIDDLKIEESPGPVTVALKNGLLLYKDKFVVDKSGIGKKNPGLLIEAYALNLRYEYLSPSTHGLSRVYDEMGFMPADDVLEGFASVFNHYFDNYCGAFPDLEKYFGSIGSFFDLKEFHNSIVYVNPPFDESTIKLAIKHVLDICGPTHYIMTLPYWKDFDPFSEYKKTYDPVSHSGTLAIRRSNSIKFEYRKRNETKFKDYDTLKMIYPCEILIVHLVINKD